MTKYLLFLALAISVAFGGVLDLTSSTFDDAISDNSLIMVKFYAPWCGHCKRLAPEYDAAQKNLEDLALDAVLAKVDCTENEDVCQKFGVRGYPTLKVFLNGDVDGAKDYANERSAKAITDFMAKKAQPPVSQIASQDDLDVLVNGAENSVAVIFVADVDGNDYDTFQKIAAELDDFTFGVVSDASLAEELGATMNSIRIYREWADDVDYSEFPLNVQGVKDFINDKGFPLLVEIGQSSYQRLAKEARPIVIAVLDYEEEEEKEEWLQAFSELADEFNGKVSLTYGSSAALERAIESFGGTGNVVPSIIGMKSPEMDPESTLPDRWAWNEDNELTQESIREWLEGIANGHVDPYKKSEPVPEDNSGGVKVVVGKTFDRIVLNTKKNVFVKFYAPWCGHCKSLAPIWDELGESFSSSSDIVIAKVDATANFVDPSYQITGFPTLILFKEGEDNEMVKYSGERTLEALQAFVEEQTGATASEEAPHPRDEL